MGLWSKGAEKWREKTSSKEKVALALHLESNHSDKIGKIQLDYLSIMCWLLSSTFIIQLIFPELYTVESWQPKFPMSSTLSGLLRKSFLSATSLHLLVLPQLFPKSDCSEHLHIFIPCCWSNLLTLIMGFPSWQETGPVPLTCSCDEGPNSFCSVWDRFERVRHLYSEKLHLCL